MKKLLVLVLVLAMAQVSGAAVVSLTTTSPTEVVPSQIITVQMIADFGVSMLGVDSITGPGTSSAPVLNDLFNQAPENAGTIINNGTVLLQALAGSTDMAAGDIAAGQVLWSMTYHVPNLPPSTYITIGATGVGIWSAEFEGAEADRKSVV